VVLADRPNGAMEQDIMGAVKVGLFPALRCIAATYYYHLLMWGHDTQAFLLIRGHDTQAFLLMWGHDTWAFLAILCTLKTT
jgi:hypothetical protein